MFSDGVKGGGFNLVGHVRLAHFLESHGQRLVSVTADALQWRDTGRCWMLDVDVH